ncbi:L-PSP family endoribonuclease [Pandoraea horticolens]|uniref:L-PSP family endoribonuclease n=1 Tax=Pandoraea horticolens TaxID=2508298 RepID=A0A5E4YYI3_9BURK|nr:RidA family protein [Pandoraea horticolens]VVE54001.1 L-PSP family endoribonuclease [Pandoraea horticolens]
MTLIEKLHSLSLVLPAPPAPAASYVAVSRHERLLYVSGQGPMQGFTPIITGRVGADVTEERAAQAARLAALNALAALHNYCGLDRIESIVKLTAFVCSTADFHRQHIVVNGASDLLISLFGSAGLHSRSAVGVYTLPFNIPVEIELIAAMTPD